MLQGSATDFPQLPFRYAVPLCHATSPLDDISASTAELTPQNGLLGAKLGSSAYIANKG